MSQPRISNAFDTMTLEEKEVIWCSGNREQKFMIETSGRGRDISKAVAPMDSLMSADDGDKGRMGSFSEREIDCLADCSCCWMSSSSNHVCLSVLDETLLTPEVNSCCSSNSSSDKFEGVETGNETGAAARCQRVTKSDGN